MFRDHGHFHLAPERSLRPGEIGYIAVGTRNREVPRARAWTNSPLCEVLLGWNSGSSPAALARVWLLLAAPIRPPYLLVIIEPTTLHFLSRPQAWCGLQLRLAPMDPLQKWESALISGSSQVTIVETSQEGSASSHLISLEQLRLDVSGLSTNPGSGAPTPLAEGLLQRQCTEQNNFLEQRCGRLGFPQKKKAFLGQLRRRHRDHRAPYPVEKDSRIFRSGNRAQNWFRCECLYCQARGQNIIGERDGASNPSSWDTLVQGLGGLTLSLGAERSSLLPEGAQQQQPQQPQRQRQQSQRQPEEKCQRESKRRFHKLFKQWLEEN
ncbi:protein FAM156A/FAM156B-like isoform X2 [Peromyscus californicus insignis]|uniref:protein FAM156A/FAM156B-like isoform X2 n=1 Tax=Peromyscus californicus insignis TaxID=564181 RepID=UPI0022A7F491|nr:protein FAM156A/FAM156B-like isoform X2 [Peromyscus californicus insignis]